MKKMLVLLLLVGVLMIRPVQGAVDSNSTGSVTYGAVHLITTFVNQDPYPAQPDGYVTLLFKLENWGTEKANDVVFELLPEYPLSLDPGANATTELGVISGLQNNQKAALIKYKVKVDKDAVVGDNEIGVRYTFGNSGYYYTSTFNITVSDPKTDFEVVMQDSTGTSKTLAIANIGSNTAYSVVVSIPGQQNFMAEGVSANIIGNLNAGDYTLVSFEIASTSATNRSAPNGAIPFNRSGVIERNPLNNSIPSSGSLTVQISYTDTLGIRRTVQKQVDLGSLTAASGTSLQQFSIGQSSNLSNGLTYIAIGAVGIVAIVLFFKFRGRRKK